MVMLPVNIYILWHRRKVALRRYAVMENHGLLDQDTLFQVEQARVLTNPTRCLKSLADPQQNTAGDDNESPALIFLCVVSPDLLSYISEYQNFEFRTSDVSSSIVLHKKHKIPPWSGNLLLRDGKPNLLPVCAVNACRINYKKSWEMPNRRITILCCNTN